MSKFRKTGNSKMDHKSQVKVTGYFNRSYTGENTSEFIGGHAKKTWIDLETEEVKLSIPLESAAAADLHMKSQSESFIIYRTSHDNVENIKETDAKEKKTEEEVITHIISSKELSEDAKGRKGVHEESENIAPDGGWGYMVTVGCFIVMNICNIIGPCFGVLFSSYLLDLGTSSTMVTWIFNMQALMFGLSNLTVGPLVEYYGWRLVVFLGGVLCFLSLAASAFASSAWFLLFSYSVLGGLGAGMSTTVSFVILPHYFKRRRGRSNAFMTGGICTGQMIGPPLVTLLQQEYGFQGATLIVAALSLNICVAAALFHPVEWHSKTLNRNNKIIKSKTSSGVGAMLVGMIRSVARNFKIIKSIRALILSVGGSFIITGYLNFFMLVPFVMVAGGYTQEAASWCMSVSAVCNLATRLVVSSLTDWPRFNMRGSFMTGTLIIAVITAVFSWVEGVWAVCVVLAAWGCGVGAFSGVLNLLVVDYMGLENVIPLFSAWGLVSCVWLLVFSPLFGLVLDESGSYKVSLGVLGGVTFIGFVLWIFMPAAVAYDKRHEARQQSQQQQSQQENHHHQQQSQQENHHHQQQSQQENHHHQQQSQQENHHHQQQSQQDNHHHQQQSQQENHHHQQQSQQENHHHQQQSQQENHHHQQQSQQENHHHQQQSQQENHHHQQQSQQENHHHQQQSQQENHHHQQQSQQENHHHQQQSQQENHHHQQQSQENQQHQIYQENCHHQQQS